MDSHQLKTSVASLFPLVDYTHIGVNHDLAVLTDGLAKVGIFGVHKVAVVKALHLLQKICAHYQERSLHELTLKVLGFVHIVHGVVSVAFFHEREWSDVSAEQVVNSKVPTEYALHMVIFRGEDGGGHANFWVAVQKFDKLGECVGVKHDIRVHDSMIVRIQLVKYEVVSLSKTKVLLRVLVDNVLVLAQGFQEYLLVVVVVIVAAVVYDVDFL